MVISALINTPYHLISNCGSKSLAGDMCLAQSAKTEGHESKDFFTGSSPGLGDTLPLLLEQRWGILWSSWCHWTPISLSQSETIEIQVQQYIEGHRFLIPMIKNVGLDVPMLRPQNCCCCCYLVNLHATLHPKISRWFTA